MTIIDPRLKRRNVIDADVLGVNEYLQRAHKYLTHDSVMWDIQRTAADWAVESEGFMQRGQFVKEYAWGVPNEAALAEIAKHGPIIEIGAGTGYWAHRLALLQPRLGGVDARALPGRHRAVRRRVASVHRRRHLSRPARRTLRGGSLRGHPAVVRSPRSTVRLQAKGPMTRAEQLALYRAAEMATWYRTAFGACLEFGGFHLANRANAWCLEAFGFRLDSVWLMGEQAHDLLVAIAVMGLDDSAPVGAAVGSDR